MKNLITLFYLLTAGLASFAGNNPEELKIYRTQQFSYAINFNKIVVKDNIDLVIYENASTNIQFDGNKEDIDNVEWKIKNGVLIIGTKKGHIKNKVIVTIDVAKLTEITLEGQSVIRSLGNLDTPELTVYMKAGCVAAIRNTGTINIINTDETEMNVIQRTGNVTVR
ncbi:MAG: DUF2807 domain-containing protein [Bacteroidetes bacterium]|nr:DUF2807 domain-containing protein [Bacteroidota bacterium]